MTALLATLLADARFGMEAAFGPITGVSWRPKVIAPVFAIRKLESYFLEMFFNYSYHQAAGGAGRPENFGRTKIWSQDEWE
jgi:hypothetical protein